MRLPRPRTTLGRAVLPVLAGIGVFALLGLATWIAALLLSRNPEGVSERLVPDDFPLGRPARWAEEVAENGPIVFHDLARPDGTRSIVLDHTGDDPNSGWAVYYAHPDDRSPDCKVEQIERTRQFRDCAQRTVEVGQLARPPDIRPAVEIDELLSITFEAPVTTTTGGA